MPKSVSCLIFKTLLFILFPISIYVFRRGTPCIARQSAVENCRLASRRFKEKNW